MWNNAKDKYSGVTAVDVLGVYEYNPSDGHLRWKIAKQKIIKGAIAGYTNSQDGYHYVGFNHKEFMAHRLVWLIMTGEWPKEQIDHINGIRSDNRWLNLRQQSNSQGGINKTINVRNKTGVTGVDVRRGKYRVRIHKDEKEIVVGWFDTLDEAARARKEAEIHYFGEFSPDKNRSTSKFMRIKPVRKKKVIIRDLDPKEHLMMFVKTDEKTGCWNWTGSTTGFGYGVYTNRKINNGITTAASRASWIIHFGEIEEQKMVVRHVVCRNPRCRNPDHLELGTYEDNGKDTIRDGTINRGEDRPQSRLTEADVREARQLRQKGAPWRKLADRYGVTMNCVRSAIEGTTWKHVDEPIPTYQGKAGNPYEKAFVMPVKKAK